MVPTQPPTPSLEELLTSLVSDVTRDREGLSAALVGRWSRPDPDSGSMVSGAMTASESRSVEEIVHLLEVDTRYEHLAKPKDAVLDLFAHLTAAPTSDGVVWFRTRFAQTPRRRTCFLPVRHLGVGEPLALFGIELLPVESDLIPKDRVWMTLEPPVGCVAMVSVEGTNLDKMRDRAREVTNRALRLLRISLREHNALSDRQLRFTLDDGYLFDEGVEGWAGSRDRAADLSSAELLSGFVSAQAVWALADAPTNDFQEHVERAAQWLEKAMFEDDTTVAALFAFFALEALLGDALPKAKGAPIAYRLMMLSHVVDGTFLEPLTPALLYKHVRNDAVHGSDSVEVSADALRHLLLVVRFAIRQGLLLAQQESLSTRAELCSYLEGHADRRLLGDWLREHYGVPKQSSPLKNLIEYVGSNR